MKLTFRAIVNAGGHGRDGITRIHLMTDQVTAEQFADIMFSPSNEADSKDSKSITVTMDFETRESEAK